MSTRREFVRHSILAIGGLHAARSLWAQAGTPVTVATPLGKLVGESKGEVNVFRGVPFAKPPVGPLRFRPPQAAEPWTAERDATRFAKAAVQPGEEHVAQSEDCLYLNVWSPRQPGSYPVFVWIHGGGFTGGRSFDPLFDGTGFAEQGIVCVTMAYRLGVLGFLDMEPCLGQAYAGSANNALRDVIAALSWVKGNVAAFGGDPHRVTVGGESAGAKLTDLLMGVPSAGALFQQAISESGGAERIWPKDRALEVGNGFRTAWTARSGSAASSVADAPVRDLIAVQETFTREWPAHFPLRCELDGVLIAQPPLAAIRGGSTRGKRLLLGTNRDESALFIGPHPTKDATARDLGNMAVEQFRPIDEAYGKRFPDLSPELRRIRSLTAEEYLVPSMRVAEAHLAGGGQAYVYRLDFAGEGRYANLAFHSYDLRFVWDHFGEGIPSDSAKTLAASMHAAWTAFIQGKPPSGPGLSVWPLYSTREQQTMILDVPSRVVSKPEAAELALWDGVLTK